MGGENNSHVGCEKENQGVEISSSTEVKKRGGFRPPSREYTLICS